MGHGVGMSASSSNAHPKRREASAKPVEKAAKMVRRMRRSLDWGCDRSMANLQFCAIQYFVENYFHVFIGVFCEIIVLTQSLYCDIMPASKRRLHEKRKMAHRILERPNKRGTGFNRCENPCGNSDGRSRCSTGELEVVKGMLPESGNDFVRSLRVYRIVQGSKPISQGKSCDKE